MRKDHTRHLPIRAASLVLLATSLISCGGRIQQQSPIQQTSRILASSKGTGDRALWDRQCPKIGTVVHYSDGRIITWAGEDPIDDMSCVGRDISGGEVRWVMGMIDVNREEVGIYRAALSSMFPGNPKANVSFQVSSAAGVSVLEDWELGDRENRVHAYGRSWDIIRLSRVRRSANGSNTQAWTYLLDSKTAVLLSVEGAIVHGVAPIGVPSIYALSVTFPTELLAPPPPTPAGREGSRPQNQVEVPEALAQAHETAQAKPASAIPGFQPRRASPAVVEPGIPPMLDPLEPHERRQVVRPSGGW